MIGAIGVNSTDRLHRQRDSMAAARQPCHLRRWRRRSCLPFIQRQIELVNPDVLVTLGNVPRRRRCCRPAKGIMRTRGRWFDYETGGRTIRALPTFHPAYLLRSPS